MKLGAINCSEPFIHYDKYVIKLNAEVLRLCYHIPEIKQIDVIPPPQIPAGQ
jgi:hypothetical protein